MKEVHFHQKGGETQFTDCLGNTLIREKLGASLHWKSNDVPKRNTWK